MTPQPQMTRGRPWPMGAHFDGEGVNFAVFSAHASAIEFCLFDHSGTETARLALPEREGDIWFGYVTGLLPGQNYGLRAHGPYRPDEGHHFNPNKLLLDPYAREISGRLKLHDAMLGFQSSSAMRDLSFDTTDSAAYMPKCIIAEPMPDYDGIRLNRPMSETVIYEAHVKGMTQRLPGVEAPGSFASLASQQVLDHLTDLGITAIELLPVQYFIDDKHVFDRGLSNYWGYQTTGFFAPDPRYAGNGAIQDFRNMVARFHTAGIEVILDVVYNHTGEGDAMGPTISFRGLDNSSYYQLSAETGDYLNPTGTGNALDLTHPMVLRMVMDSMRYWVQVMGVDGFRFDLAATLGRNGHGFNRRTPFFDAIAQDPVLSRVKLIAEPWDIGHDGYQLGAFPSLFSEWNDKFRDGVRRFWRMEPGRVADLAERLTGSARQFDHSGRPATASVNYIASHDGFTLADLTRYLHRHNMANLEFNADGHTENFSDNLGAEGNTYDPAIKAARDRRARAMLATVFLSEGVPMLLAGDEIGNSQQGNNNAYCQDNETSWIDWENADWELYDWSRQVIAFRKAHPILRQRLFLHSQERGVDGLADLFWWRADGKPMQHADWENPEIQTLGVEMRTASETPDFAAHESAIFLCLNAGELTDVTIPACPAGMHWVLGLDSAHPGKSGDMITGEKLAVEVQSVIALVLEPAD